MTSRSIEQVFEQFQKARLCFAQSMADLALRQQNVDILAKNGVLELLRSLLNDTCPQIRQTAAVALGRLVHHDAHLAEELINKNFMPLILHCVYHGNKHQKKTVLFVLRSMCKHDGYLANCVIGAGGLQAFIACLEDFEACVKESAAWGIGYIARHSKNLAQACVEAGSVPLLMLCLQEPELSLKQVTTSAISDIAKHSLELAQNVVDSGVVPYLVKNLENTDEKLKRQILTALSSCAKHSTELAEVIVEADIIATLLLHLGHPCPMVRRNAAALVRDIVKHSLELAQMVVNTGGIGALMETLNQNMEEERGAKIPAITALGFISGHSDQFAMSVIGCKAIVLLAQILEESKDEILLTVTVWCLGQIGKHSPEHSHAVAATNIFPKLLNYYCDKNTSEDLKYKCKNALKLCLQKCLLIAALEPLLYYAPPNILKYTLGQYSKVKNLELFVNDSETSAGQVRISKAAGLWKSFKSFIISRPFHVFSLYIKHVLVKLENKCFLRLKAIVRKLIQSFIELQLSEEAPCSKTLQQNFLVLYHIFRKLYKDIVKICPKESKNDRSTLDRLFLGTSDISDG